jgi:hypothetical protein
MFGATCKANGCVCVVATCNKSTALAPVLRQLSFTNYDEDHAAKLKVNSEVFPFAGEDLTSGQQIPVCLKSPVTARNAVTCYCRFVYGLL